MLRRLVTIGRRLLILRGIRARRVVGLQGALHMRALSNLNDVELAAGPDLAPSPDSGGPVVACASG